MPEKVNCVLTDHPSALFLSSTATAVKNLARQRIREGVHVMGDIKVDALEFNLHLAEERSTVIERLDLPAVNYLVLTVHCVSNSDDRYRIGAILDAVGEMGARAVFPMLPARGTYSNDTGSGCRRTTWPSNRSAT